MVDDNDKTFFENLILNFKIELIKEINGLTKRIDDRIDVTENKTTKNTTYVTVQWCLMLVIVGLITKLMMQ